MAEKTLGWEEDYEGKMISPEEAVNEAGMDFQIGFTDKEITPWGGMALMKKMLNQSRIDDFLSSLELPQPRSNRGYHPEQIINSFWVSVWCGANRFLHTEVTRQDVVIRQIFGWRRVCGQDTYKRFFQKFTQALNQRVSTAMYRWFFQGIHFDNYTLDLDSSVLTRYGNQEGLSVDIIRPRLGGNLIIP